jgi:nitrogen fixation protein FixH
MNWGHKIAITFTLFAVGILWLVFKSMNQKIDLVTTDYYAKELKYQEKIDAKQRTAALDENVKHEIKNGLMEITLPKQFGASQANGSVLLYCPVDGTKDIQKNFSTAGGKIIINVPSANKGLHELQVSWEAEGKTYYYEEKIYL